MGQTCHFLFGIHNHQPVGNFESVFEKAFELAYLPFIQVLERHPKIRIAMHFSGCLLDYLIPHHPEYIEMVKELGARGQIEFMTGAYYEPILPIVPDHDKVGQIRKLSDTIEKYMGQRPVGMWLAERVWEPHLPRTMAEAGVKYCVLDDTHFKCSGLTERECFGYYITDELDSSVVLFPILEKFRYTIPFQAPAETVEYIRRFAAAADRPLLAVMADDGEKFGIWPETNRHCYQNSWLEDFFSVIEERADEFPMIHFREALESHEPLGRIYLPTASYFEMMEWALPAGAIHRYERAQEEIRNHQLSDAVGAFFRGGFWRNFMAKYPESNQIHKKMLYISRRIAKAIEAQPTDQALHSAQEFLWRGQCNCAYWHGVFGGLYLAHLRHALHRNLNIAHRLLGEIQHGGAPWLTIERLDYDADTHEELVIETDQWGLVVAPRLGGVLQEVNYKPRDLNLADTLARREEAYHRLVAGAVVRQETQDGAESIHGAPRAKEKGLERLLRYDTYRRLFAIDHFFPAETSFEDYAAMRHREIGDFVTEAYQDRPTLSGKTVMVSLRRDGRLDTAEGPRGLRLSKHLHVAAGNQPLVFVYTIKNISGAVIDAVWGVEFNVNLLAGDAHDRYPFVEGREVRDRRLVGEEATEETRVFGLIDEWMDVRVRFELANPARLWRTAIETVSASEDGFERVYQGTTLLPNWLIHLGPGEERTERIEVACMPWRMAAA
ncbi:MAG: DUF1926 domain-containing protein [bacterium]|nr:DUF1926 domain-containing protein [bacterium]